MPRRKRTKLQEKPTRLPDVAAPAIAESVRKYLSSVSKQQTETARASRFLLLLNDLFGQTEGGFIEEYIAGMERYVPVKRKGVLLRGGRIDTLYGNLVIEFERDLRRKLSEAQSQLRRYVAGLWTLEGNQRRNYVAMATDGVVFKPYSPRVISPDILEPGPDQVQLDELQSADLAEFGRRDLLEVYFWLDRYFLRKEPRRPTAEEFVTDFGLGDYAYSITVASLAHLWNRISHEPEISVLYENWEKYLRFAYGTNVASELLFLRHTYLATLAKLTVWARMDPRDFSPPDQEILDVLAGKYFERHGIENFLEEDFFSWLAREPARATAVALSRKLFHQLRSYHLPELSEDVLKELYQELVDPETRRELGEYYTPDWLASRMVDHALRSNPAAKVLDPACGSGTFLYQAIRFKREQLGDTEKTLRHIEQSVVGIDIHPLAVTISRINYLLGLGERLRTERKRPLRIPVYLANSIRPPELITVGDLGLAGYYGVTLDSANLRLPQQVLENPEHCDTVINLLRDFAASFANKPGASKENLANWLEQKVPGLKLNDEELEVLFDVAKWIRGQIEAKHDTIWAFVLRNIYKPIFLKEGFDVVIGNPPWLQYKAVESGEYQKYLKEQITEKGYRLLVGKGQLITHMELATLFFVRSADLYLKKGGTIAFLLPHSIFRADHHDRFRQQQFAGFLGIQEVWDLENVRPLFHVGAAAVFAKSGEEAQKNFSGERLAGTLQRKNASLQEAREELEVQSLQLQLHSIGERTVWAERGKKVSTPSPSPYAKLFRQGATIVPRAAWFVQPSVHPQLGIDLRLPFLQSDPRAEKKAQQDYRSLRLRGQVEAEFLYGTLLSTDLVPFGHLPLRPVVLPIVREHNSYTLLNTQEARAKGHPHLAAWLEQVESEWQQRRKEKAARMSIYERLDRGHGITAQRLTARYRVLYPDIARVMCAAVAEEKGLFCKLNGETLPLQGLVIESKLYYYETDNEREAKYLEAVLNSETVDKLLSSFRTRRQFNAPDIHKKVWEFPIPRFDEKLSHHRELAQLAKTCSLQVPKLVAKYPNLKSLGRLRRLIASDLKHELAEIDHIVAKLLQ